MRLKMSLIQNMHAYLIVINWFMRRSACQSRTLIEKACERNHILELSSSINIKTKFHGLLSVENRENMLTDTWLPQSHAGGQVIYSRSV